MHFSLHSQAPASKAKHCNMNLMLSCSEGSPQRNSNNSLKSCVQIGWNTIKGNVQGSYYANSTWLYTAMAKPNMIIKTKKLSIFWNYLALMWKAEVPYLPPLNLNHKFLFQIFFNTTEVQYMIRLYCNVPENMLVGVKQDLKNICSSVIHKAKPLRYQVYLISDLSDLSDISDQSDLFRSLLVYQFSNIYDLSEIWGLNYIIPNF